MGSYAVRRCFCSISITITQSPCPFEFCLLTDTWQMHKYCVCSVCAMCNRTIANNEIEVEECKTHMDSMFYLHSHQFGLLPTFNRAAHVCVRVCIVFFCLWKECVCFFWSFNAKCKISSEKWNTTKLTERKRTQRAWAVATTHETHLFFSFQTWKEPSDFTWNLYYSK